MFSFIRYFFLNFILKWDFPLVRFIDCIPYSTFRDNMNLLPPVDSSIRSSFWQFSIFGWCSPLLLLILSVMLQARQNGNLLKVNDLKVANCWFLGHDAFLFGFAIPVAFLVLINIICLIRTAFVIRQTVSIQVQFSPVHAIS